MIRHVRGRRAALAAAAVASTLLLGACGTDGGPVVTAPTSTPSSTAPVTTPTPAPTASRPTASPAPSRTDTVEPQTPTPTPPSPTTTEDSPTRSPSPSTTVPRSPARTQVLLSCVTSALYIKRATTEWNKATKTRSRSVRRAAAKTMASTATKLRRQGRKSADARFNRLARRLAKDFDQMAAAVKNGTSVDASGANEHRRNLSDYCVKFARKPSHATTAG